MKSTDAWEVLIWLGKAKQNSGRAFDLMAKMKRDWENAGGLDAFDVVGYLQQLQDRGEQPLRLLHDIFDNRWWTRIWTIQEAVLCGRTIMVQGKHRMGIEDIQPFMTGQFAVATYPNQLRLETEDDEELRRRLLNSIRKIELWLIKYGIPWTNDMFPRLLDGMRAYQCTDNRDRVYGVLGLLSPEARDFSVDYAKSVTEVYIDVVAFHIEKMRDLTILSYAEVPPHTKSTPSTPSWCPDWVKPGSERLLKLCPGRTPLLRIGRATLYSATRGQPPIISINRQAASMKVDGFRIASIRGWTMLLTLFYIYNKQHSLIVRQVCDQLEIPTDGEVPSELRHLFWSTGTGDQCSRPDGYHRMTPAEFESRFLGSVSDESIVEGFRREASQEACGDRRILIVDGGYKLALGPWNAQRRDFICALFGGDCLYVLGDRDGRLKYIGEWYIHSRRPDCRLDR